MMTHKLLPGTEEVTWQAIKDLKYTEKTLKEDVDAIMGWFMKQPHLVEAGIDPDVVRTFLLMANGSREKTKKRIDNYYKYRSLAPELIQSRKEALTSSKNLWTWYRQAAITRLFEGRRVTVIQFTDPNLSIFSIEELFRNLYMIMDLRLKYEYVRGEIWVIDARYATLAHLVRVNLTALQRASQLFQEGLDCKVHAIHVLNFPGIGHKFIDLFRKFVKDKIMDRVIIHSCLEDLHKVLPKRYLPKDYGGEELSMQEFKDMYEKELRSEETKQFLLDLCKQVSNEKKRPGADINEEYLAGTFKKLDCD